MNAGKFVRGLVGVAALVTCGVSQAAYAIYIYQDGPDVIASGSGTVNTTALTNSGGHASSVSQVLPDIGIAWIGSGPWTSYSVIAGPVGFGTGQGNKIASSSTGGAVGVAMVPQTVIVPQGYVSGSSLSSGARWDGQTIANLGMTPGTYKWTWGVGPTADSFTLVIGSPPPSASPASIPTLSEWSLIGLTTILAMFGIARMRRHQA